MILGVVGNVLGVWLGEGIGSAGGGVEEEVGEGIVYRFESRALRFL